MGNLLAKFWRLKKMHSSEFLGGAGPNRLQQVNFWGTTENGLFYPGETEMGENLHFFIKRSAPENFQCEIFLKGVPTESLRTHGSEYVY